MATLKFPHLTVVRKNDPDHHDVFPGGKRAVEAKATPTISQIFTACLSLQKHQADYAAVARETGIPRLLVAQIARDYRAAWLSRPKS